MSVVRCSSCDAANKGRDTCGGCGALLCVSISAAHLRALTPPTDDARGREIKARWQPVETAPHNEPVLLAEYDSIEKRWILRVGPYSWGWRMSGISNMAYDGYATHWRPLPSPPADDAGGER